MGRSCALDSSQDSTAVQQGKWPKSLGGQGFLKNVKQSGLGSIQRRNIHLIHWERERHMAVLFFLPWVACDAPKKVGPINLHPYLRKKLPGTLHGIGQEAIDGILGSYGDPDFAHSGKTSKHVTRATLITWDGDSEGLELQDGEAMSRLEQARYLTFSALSARHYCSHFAYCNADGYQVIGQRFTADSPGATSITTRRRDGQGLHHLGDSKAPRFIRPQHVDTRLDLTLDEPLLAALVNLSAGDSKTLFDDAIDAYVLANSDSPTMRERSEMVLLRVAFETLLDSTHTASDLREKFAAHFSAELPVPPKWHSGIHDEACWRVRWPTFVSRPMDAWVQDFCAARNSAAHGPRGTKALPVWRHHNHLLFGSWLFPLMVKKMLQDAGLYQLREEEKAERGGCEAFLAHDLLSPAGADKRGELWWSKVDGTISSEVRWKQVFRSQGHI